MVLFIFYCLLLVAGLSAIETVKMTKVFHDAVEKFYFHELSQLILTIHDVTLVSNCKTNGYQNAGEELYAAIDKRKSCIHKKPLLVTRQDKYLNTIEDCSKDVVDKAKACLKDSQQYFPELYYIDLEKSKANFLYEEGSSGIVEFYNCIKTIFTQDRAQRKLIECVIDEAHQSNFTFHIPHSKSLYCQKHIAGLTCSIKTMKENCDNTSSLLQTLENYSNSAKEACDTN